MMEDFQRAAKQMLFVLNRHGVPEHVQKEIVDVVEGRPPPGLETAVGTTAPETPTDGWDDVEPVVAAAAPG